MKKRLRNYSIGELTWRLHSVPAGRTLLSIARRNKVKLREHDSSRSLGVDQGTTNLINFIFTRVPVLTEKDCTSIPVTGFGKYKRLEADHFAREENKKLQDLKNNRHAAQTVKSRAQAAAQLLSAKVQIKTEVEKRRSDAIMKDIWAALYCQLAEMDRAKGNRPARKSSVSAPAQPGALARQSAAQHLQISP